MYRLVKNELTKFCHVDKSLLYPESPSFFFSVVIVLKRMIDNILILAAIVIIVAIILCTGNSTLENFAAPERPNDVERARNIRKRIEREQRREEDERSFMYGGGWFGGPVAGPGYMFAPGPYGRRAAPGFYEPEVNFTLMKGKAPTFFDPSDDFISKDVTKLLSNCSARFNPNCQTIVHDLDSGKAYRYDRPAGSLKSNSRVNTYALL